MIVGVLALPGMVPAYAQGTAKVNVPFEFIVGESVLPAGNYVAVTIPDHPDAVLIQSVDGRSGAWALGPGNGLMSRKADAVFSFKKVGGRYFLSEIDIPGAAMRSLPLPQKNVEAVLARLNGKSGVAGRPSH